jgi:hypothetical protein
MQYGKIDNKVHRLAGLADITLRLGCTKEFRDVITFDVYTGFVIPTGYKPTAEYLFEPLVGNGQHFGVNFGYNLVSKITGDISFVSCFDYRYLFEGKEKRSFDLKQNGPWSRYMAATVGLPRNRPQRLINYLTDDVYVSPGSLANILFAFHIKHKKYNFEIGSDIECRAAENIHLKKGFNTYVGIALYDEDDPSSMLVPELETYNRTNPRAKINETMLVARDDYTTFEAITYDQLNLDSAKHPNIVSAKFYVSVGAQGTINDKPFLFNIGGTYAFGSDNKALDYWNMYMKLSMSI